MDLNHETAMKLWNKRFGNAIKAKDFSGREIAKGAYNDRNSEFGWNIDHVLPQKLGGKTAEHNLVICNIKTNDEKADKFPGFVANNQKFTIVKVENHYEIKSDEKSETKTDKKDENDGNFYDSAYGIKLYKTFKGLQTKPRFVGTVEIELKGISGADTALTDFIESLFIQEDIQFVEGQNNYYLYGKDIRMIIKNYEMPHNSDVNDLLDKCVLLNTYLDSYFKPIGVISDYLICFRLDCYKQRRDFYQNDTHVRTLNSRTLFSDNDHLIINSLVAKNSYAKKDFKDDPGWDTNKFFNYGYIFTKLASNLKRKVEEK